MIPYLSAIRAGLGAALLLGIYYGGYRHASARCEMNQLLADAERAAAVKTVQRLANEEVSKYVEQIETLNDRAVVRERLVRLCQSRPKALRPAGDTAAALGAAATDPDDRSVDDLAEDLHAAQINKARQAALAKIVQQIYDANQPRNR